PASSFSDFPSSSSNPHATFPASALPPRHSARLRQPPSYLHDYHCYLASASAGTNPSISSGTLYPLYSVLSYSHLSPSQFHYTMSISTYPEPRSYAEAVKHAHWRQAMQREIEALELNNTWTITHLPPDKRVIGCKWVFRVKYNADGSIE